MKGDINTWCSVLDDRAKKKRLDRRLVSAADFVATFEAECAIKVDASQQEVFIDYLPTIEREEYAKQIGKITPNSLPTLLCCAFMGIHRRELASEELVRQGRLHSQCC